MRIGAQSASGATPEPAGHGAQGTLAWRGCRGGFRSPQTGCHQGTNEVLAHYRGEWDGLSRRMIRCAAAGSMLAVFFSTSACGSSHTVPTRAESALEQLHASSRKAAAPPSAQHPSSSSSAVPSSSSSSGNEWREITNTRYGYLVSVPPNWTAGSIDGKPLSATEDLIMYPTNQSTDQPTVEVLVCSGPSYCQDGTAFQVTNTVPGSINNLGASPRVYTHPPNRHGH